MKKLFLLILFFGFSINCLSALECTGDIRAKWGTIWDSQPTHKFKSEVNVALDYKKESAWLRAKAKASCVDFKDSSFLLQKALVGYHLFSNDEMIIDLEGGRNLQCDMFESKLQHDTHFNGLHLVYHFKVPGAINFTFNGGPHVIDSSRNRIGAVGCAHWRQIGNSPIDFKYTISHWGNHADQGQRYSISQFLVKYRIGDSWAYAAYINNHRASSLANGVYFGYTLGSLKKAYDYSLDANVQYAKANAVPGWDFCGLMKGVQVKGAFALTDEFSIQAKGSYDVKREVKALEIGGVYAW